MFSGDSAAAVGSDWRAIETIGAALEGSGKPFVSTSGTLSLAMAGISDRPGTERDVARADRESTRRTW